jgi:hypothetical protein
MLTPYQFASNSPIQGIDLDGKEINIAIKGANFGLAIVFGKINKKTVFKLTELSASAVTQIPITEQTGVTLTTSYNLDEGVSVNTKVSQDLPTNVDAETQSNPSYDAEAKVIVGKDGISAEFSGSGSTGTDYGTSENMQNSQNADSGFDDSGIEKQENSNAPIVKNPQEFDEAAANMAAKNDYSVESSKKLSETINTNSPKAGTGGLSSAPAKPLLGIEAPKNTKEFVQQMRQNMQKKPTLPK